MGKEIGRLSAISIAALVLILILAVSVTRGETVQKVNLNGATFSELNSLPGIGPITAERILEFRLENGPFKRIEELMNVRGIGEKKFLKIRELITVDSLRKKAADSPSNAKAPQQSRDG